MVGFPGFGIPNFTPPKFFKVFWLSIHWYGVVIALGFVIAAYYCSKRAKDFNVSTDEIIDMLIYAVPLGIIGARAYYVAFQWADFKSDVFGMFRIWDGGLAIYGGIIGGCLACVLFCRIRRIKTSAMLDLGAFGLLIGQAVGRWGNFFNVEVYGKVTTLPWRMYVPYEGLAANQGVHPLFLYESLWMALGLLLLHRLSKRRRFNGQIFLSYVAWYGLGRGVLESLRTPGFVLKIGTIPISQLFAFVTCSAALALLVYNFLVKKHDPEDMANWVEERDKRALEKAASKKGSAAAKEEPKAEKAEKAEIAKQPSVGSKKKTPAVQKKEPPIRASARIAQGAKNKASEWNKSNARNVEKTSAEDEADEAPSED